MANNSIILGIESSCDETAVAVVKDSKKYPKILSNIVSSQVDIHRKFGGVVPELAARSHLEKIDLIAKKALKSSGVKISDIDAVAATAGPGLIVCLSVGLSFGKSIAMSLKKPFIAINHLEGHALSPKLNNRLSYPYLLLLMSGGHTQFIVVKGLGKYERIGTTIDDAIGEAFDKVGKIIGIEFPGGPKIEEFAKLGNQNRYDLPKPIINKGGCNLSFAGLKTAVLRLSEKISTKQDKYDLAASFQKTIEEILFIKTKLAFNEFEKKENKKKKSFVLAGGVASNASIRKMFKSLCNDHNFNLICPPPSLCTDNAAMIAMAGLERFKKKKFNKLDYPVRPRWQLDEKAKFMKGAGLIL